LLKDKRSRSINSECLLFYLDLTMKNHVKPPRHVTTYRCRNSIETTLGGLFFGAFLIEYGVENHAKEIKPVNSVSVLETFMLIQQT